MDRIIDFKLPGTGNPSLWQKREGRWVIPELQSKFLDWLLTPKSDREHKSQAEWAEAHGVSAGTLGDWKKDRRFRREWEDRAAAKNIGVDRMQAVLDTVYQAAVDGDVAAAKLYIAEVEKLRPTRQVERDEDVAHLSDDELTAELRELLETDGDPRRPEATGQAAGGPEAEGIGAAEGD